MTTHAHPYPVPVSVSLLYILYYNYNNYYYYYYYITPDVSILLVAGFVTYCICALEVESVVGDEHFAFQSSTEWADVDDVLVCRRNHILHQSVGRQPLQKTQHYIILSPGVETNFLAYQTTGE